MYTVFQHISASTFSLHFYSVSAIQVPSQRQQVVTTVTTVGIFKLMLLGWTLQIKSDDVILSDLKHTCISDWTTKSAIWALFSIEVNVYKITE